MDKIARHDSICAKLHETYKNKNNDYGDSFSKLRKEHPNAILVRIGDKYNRLKTLMGGVEQKVSDESIRDTLLDLANYCIMEVVEMDSEIDFEEPKDECDHNCGNCKNKSSVDKETFNPFIKILEMIAEETAMMKIAKELENCLYKPATEELFNEMEFLTHNIIQEYEEATNKATKLVIDSSFEDRTFKVFGKYGELVLKGGKLC